jgi:hypothetical protein
MNRYVTKKENLWYVNDDLGTLASLMKNKRRAIIILSNFLINKMFILMKRNNPGDR